MRVTDFWGVLGALVTVALVTTIVASPNTAPVIKASADGFTGALRAAQGN